MNIKVDFLTIFDFQKTTLMYRMLLSTLLLLNGLNVSSQSNGNIVVYSTVGKVELKNGKITKQLKSYDQLSPQSILNFSENSKLYFISSEQKMFEFSKPGKFSVSKIISSVKSSSGEIGNAMSLIIHHFIEKGKSYHDKISFNAAGVVTRGEAKLLLFPVYNTLILKEYKINPVFNSELIDSATQLNIDLEVNDKVMRKYQIKPGAFIELPNEFGSKDEVFLRISYKSSTENIKLIFATEQKKNAVEKDLSELATHFKFEEELLLAKALYFESKGFYVDALGCYNKLVELSNNSSNYIDQRNAFLNDVTTQ